MNKILLFLIRLLSVCLFLLLFSMIIVSFSKENISKSFFVISELYWGKKDGKKKTNLIE